MDQLRNSLSEIDSKLAQLDESRTYEMLKNNLLNLDNVFGASVKQGPSPFYLICNSVPKAGTYLLVELAKFLQQHEDCGFHLYSNGIGRRSSDGRFDQIRKIPPLISTSALKPGMTCAAHLEYSWLLEQHFMSRMDHKMLFIIRDPRDLIISWVDFTYSSPSFARMRAWNAYAQQKATESYTTDADRIAASIEGLLGLGLERYFPWINSPACHPLKFEDIFSELQSASSHPTPCLDSLFEYLEIAKDKQTQVASVLGRGLTASDRTEKIGIYKHRMNSDHIARIKQSDFQRLVIEFGYQPT